MQFADSNIVSSNPDRSAPRRGFFSFLFGSRRKGGVAEEKHESVAEQGTLTSANLDSHNEATGHGEAKSVDDDRRSNASTISRSSRGSRRSRASRSSNGSRVSKASHASRVSRVSHGSQAGKFVHNPDTIVEEEDEEDDGDDSVFEDETFEEMRKRMDRDELKAYPPGQRRGFWEARRKAFSDLPLPPPPSKQVEDDDEERVDDEPLLTALTEEGTDSGVVPSPSKGVAHEATAGGSSPSSPLQQQHPVEQGEEDGEESPAKVQLRPIDSFTREQRIMYLRGTLPADARAALEQDLKSHRRLRREFRHKLTWTTLSGEKRIPIPPPRVPPPFL